MKSEKLMLQVAVSFLMMCYMALPLNSFCQKKVDVTWGPEYKYDRKAHMMDIIGKDDKGVFILRNGRKDEYTIEKYSTKNMSLIFSKTFELPKADKDNFDLMEIYRIDGQMLVFSLDHNKKERRSRIYVQKLSDEGILDSKYKMLDQVDYDERKQSASFEIDLSPDSTKFLLYRNQDKKDKWENEKFHFKVYDKSLNELWDKSFELPYRDDVISLSHISLGNEGHVYIQTEKVPDRKKGEKNVRKIQNIKFHVLVYYPQSDDLKQYEISLGVQNWISDMNYTINVDGDLMVAGFYSDEDANTMDGVFFLKIDKDSKEIAAKNMKKFDRDFLLHFMKEKHVDKGNKDLGVFDLDPPVLRSDGGMIQLAEYYRYYVTTFTDSKGNTRTTHHYLYNDILVINIDPDGKIDWTSVVQKKQHTTNDGGYYSSYAMGIKNDNLHFVFNDNPKNIVQYEKDPLKLKDMTNAKKAVTMLVTVDGDGNARRIPLFEAKDLKTILRPKFHYVLGQGLLLIYGIKGSKYKFGKIDFSH